MTPRQEEIVGRARNIVGRGECLLPAETLDLLGVIEELEDELNLLSDSNAALQAELEQHNG